MRFLAPLVLSTAAAAAICGLPTGKAATGKAATYARTGTAVAFVGAGIDAWYMGQLICFGSLTPSWRLGPTEESKSNLAA
jgi:hypothetical protein